MPPAFRTVRSGPEQVSTGAGIVFSPVLLAVMVLAGPAAAGDTVSGTYVEGTQKVSVKIENWGEDCGPQPKSYSKKGGKKVAVELKGDNLYFSDGSSTKSCWSANTRLKRLSATKKGSTWTTICETPPNDSRFERGEYTVKASDKGLLFVNKSTYNWQLKTSMCKATITIRKDYTLVGEKKPPVTEPEPPEKEPGKAKCKSPGSMEKLVIAPSKTRLGSGEKVCFSIYGLDGNGCRLPAPDHNLSLVAPVSSSEGSLDKNCFTAGTNAALSEGTFRIVASTEHGMTDSAKVEVKFGNIEDLIAVNLTPSDLTGDKDEESVPHAMPPSGFVEISAPEGGGHFLVWVVALSAAGILLLGGIIVISITFAKMKSSKRKVMRTVLVDESELEPSTVEQAPAQAKAERAVAARMVMKEPARSAQALGAEIKPAEAPMKMPVAGKQPRPASRDSDLKRMWMHCQVCGGDFEPGSVHCPQDGSKLIPYREISYKSAKSGLICPTCRRGYPNDHIQCPDDREYLIPYSVFRAMKSDEKSKKGKGKICPLCQKTYDDSQRFCAEDGSKLENVQ